MTDRLSSIILCVIAAHILITTIKAIYKGRISVALFMPCNEHLRPNLFWSMVSLNLLFSAVFAGIAWFTMPRQNAVQYPPAASHAAPQHPAPDQAGAH